LGLNCEKASPSPKDDDLVEVSETILLALSDEQFSSVRQMAAEYAFQKALYIVDLSILCIS
jgi:hypothetical protein